MVRLEVGGGIDIDIYLILIVLGQHMIVRYGVGIELIGCRDFCGVGDCPGVNQRSHNGQRGRCPACQGWDRSS